MHRRKTLAGASAAVLAVTLATFSAAPTNAAGSGPKIVASGLHSPRQLAFSPEGDLYVTEAGSAGTLACQTHPELGPSCLGLTGSIARIHGSGKVKRVVTRLPSIGSEEEAIGPSDITFTGEHRFALTIGLGGPPSFRDGFGPKGALLGHVVTGDVRKGSVRPKADLAAYEADVNPDGTDIDSNPVGIARWGSSFVVADAGANAVVRTPGSTVAVLPPVPAFGPNAPFPGFPADAVPTDVARGPDGAWYVSQLVGFPFEKGSASIWRVKPGQAPTRWATGLTNVTSLAFDRKGRLYAVELAENGLLAGPTGRLARITPGGSSHTTVAGDLFAPYGVAIRGSHAWVTTGSLLSDGGQVVRISLG